jgi:hypothetical protein
MHIATPWALRAFIEKTVYNAPFGLLITLSDDVSIAGLSHRRPAALVAVADELILQVDRHKDNL